MAARISMFILLLLLVLLVSSSSGASITQLSGCGASGGPWATLCMGGMTLYVQQDVATTSQVVSISVGGYPCDLSLFHNSTTSICVLPYFNASSGGRYDLVVTWKGQQPIVAANAIQYNIMTPEIYGVSGCSSARQTPPLPGCRADNYLNLYIANAPLDYYWGPCNFVTILINSQMATCGGQRQLSNTNWLVYTVVPLPSNLSSEGVVQVVFPHYQTPAIIGFEYSNSPNPPPPSPPASGAQGPNFAVVVVLLTIAAVGGVCLIVSGLMLVHCCIKRRNFSRGHAQASASRVNMSQAVNTPQYQQHLLQPQPHASLPSAYTSAIPRPTPYYPAHTIFYTQSTGPAY